MAHLSAVLTFREACLLFGRGMRFFYAVFSFLLASSILARTETINGINAVVDDSVITFAEVENLLADARSVLRAQYPNQPQVAMDCFDRL